MPSLNLTCPWSTPERILGFGIEGVGKSHRLLQVARKCPGVRFRVADCDRSHSYARALEQEFSDLKNVEVRAVDPSDWPQQLDVARELGAAGEEGDWLSWDSASPPWTAVQGWFLERRFPGRGGGDDWDVDAYFAKSARKKDDDDDSEIDWPFVNSQYFKFTRALFETRAHMYLTAEQKNMGKREDKKTTALFGRLGVRPVGQKGLGHMVHTVLHMTRDSRGGHQVTTIKDRNRQELDMEVVEDFAQGYLVGVAGWKLEVR